MDSQQTERLLAAIESIAASLKSIDKDGLLVSSNSLGHISVSAEISAPDGLQITEMPEHHFVQVCNPQSYLTGEILPFITKASS